MDGSEATAGSPTQLSKAYAANSFVCGKRFLEVAASRQSAGKPCDRATFRPRSGERGYRQYFWPHPFLSGGKIFLEILRATR